MDAGYSHRIEVYTEALVIVGWYDLPLYRRVSDALNGEQRRYVPLRDVTLTPLDKQGASQRLSSLLVSRASMVLVATIEEAVPPPDYDRDDLVRGTTPRSVMFFTSTFAVRAVMNLRPELDIVEALSREDYEEFIRLSKVQIFPIRGGMAISREFVALRRESMTALYGLPGAPLVVPVPTLPAEEAAAEPQLLPDLADTDTQSDPDSEGANA